MNVPGVHETQKLHSYKQYKNSWSMCQDLHARKGKAAL